MSEYSSRTTSTPAAATLAPWEPGYVETPRATELRLGHQADAAARASAPKAVLTPLEATVAAMPPGLRKAVQDQGAYIIAQQYGREWAAQQIAAVEGTGAPIEVLRISDLLTRPLPEWYVPGLFQESTVAVLAGEAGVGKSFVMLDIALCIASGTDFIFRSVKRGKVLYVVAEGAGSFGKRIAAWQDRKGVQVPEDRIGFVEAGVNLSDEVSMAAFTKVLEAEEADFIVLDTLSQLSSVDNENDAAQLSAVFRMAKRLRDVRPGSTVVIVHHVNKGSGKVRGSSVIRSNADTVVIARGNAKGFNLTTELAHDGKQKDGSAETIEGFKLESHLSSAVVTYTGSKAIDPHWVALQALMLDGAERRTADVRRLFTDLTDRQYQGKMRGWVNDGVLIDSGNGKAKTYQLVALAAA
jgi:hypothetical protein